MDKRLVRSRTAGKYLGPPLIVLLLFVSLPRPAGGQVAGYGGGASSPQKPEAGANTSALQALQSDFEQRRARQMLSPVYLELAEGSNPLAQALRANPDIALQYVDENGRPVYFTIHNINAAATIGTNRVHPGGSAPYSQNGSLTSSPELGVWDAGSALTTHQELVGRVVLGDGAASHWHSTHVAGTMIAAGVDPAATGMSFAAGGLRSYEWTSDNAEMAAAAAAGMYTSNHSYGWILGWFFDSVSGWMWFGDVDLSTTEDPFFGAYVQNAADWDAIAFNAPRYLIVKSAGNDRNDTGPVPGTAHWHWSSVAGMWLNSTDVHPADGTGGYDTMDATASAKNILTVGAVDDIPGGYVNPGSVVQSAFSAWGPTDDGRIKPDVVGNGVSLYSTDNASNTSYSILSGTSMSSPNVAGSINLLTQAWMYWGGWVLIGDETPAPRSATIKAIVANTADEAGPANGPDYQNGWGLMNTERAMDLIAHNVVTSFSENFPALADMGAGETHLVQNTGDAFYFYVDSPNRLPKITIAWTDPAGPVQPYAVDPAGNRLVNDLDIRMVHLGSGTVHSPWALNPGVPGNPATQSDNSRDNVEKLNIYNPAVGEYQLRVTHKGAALTNGMQNYSISWHDVTPIQPPQPTPGSVISVDSHPYVAAGSAFTRDHASGGYFLAALKEFTVTAIGIKADLLEKQTLTVDIYASSGQVRGVLLATASASVYHPGDVYQYVPINFTFQECTEYDVSVSWGEVRQLPGFIEGGSPPPFDLAGTFRILNGEYQGDAGDQAFVMLSFIGSSTSPGQLVDLDPMQGTTLYNAGGVFDSNQGRGFYFRANQTVTMCAFGMEVNHTAGQRLTANLYAATGTTRGALLATGEVTVPSTGLMWHDVPINYVVKEGEEYDLEMYLGDTSLWHWWSELEITTPFDKGPIRVVNGELDGNAANFALAHFRVSYDEGVGATPLDITTPFLGTSTMVASGGFDFGHYVTALKDQNLTSVGWMADIPAGQTIAVNVYSAVGTTRGSLITSGTLTSNGPGMRWHDVPVAAWLDGGSDYDIAIDWTATTAGFEFWANPTISQPWNAYGMFQVVVGEFGGTPDPSNEFIQMRVNSCLGEDATDVAPRRDTPAFTLHAPYPNPTSGTATIDFTLDVESKVTMNVYDVAGRRVATVLEKETRPAGLGSVRLDTRRFATGVYFIRLQTPMKSVSRKITVMR